MPQAQAARLCLLNTVCPGQAAPGLRSWPQDSLRPTGQPSLRHAATAGPRRLPTQVTSLALSFIPKSPVPGRGQARHVCPCVSVEHPGTASCPKAPRDHVWGSPVSPASGPGAPCVREGAEERLTASPEGHRLPCCQGGRCVLRGLQWGAESWGVGGVWGPRADCGRCFRGTGTVLGVHLEPVNGTFLGNRDLTDVVKLNEVRLEDSGPSPVTG